MSSAVVDANVILAFAANDDVAIAAGQQFDAWAVNETDLHAPSLLPYEVASGASSIGGIQMAKEVQGFLATLEVQLHDPPEIMELARVAAELGQRKAYDAAYVHLADTLGTELVTFDQRLARAAGETRAAETAVPRHSGPCAGRLIFNLSCGSAI